jgi:hypothetical protein
MHEELAISWLKLSQLEGPLFVEILCCCSERFPEELLALEDECMKLSPEKMSQARNDGYALPCLAALTLARAQHRRGNGPDLFAECPRRGGRLRVK